jgi:hypothetical protein
MQRHILLARVWFIRTVTLAVAGAIMGFVLGWFFTHHSAGSMNATDRVLVALLYGLGGLVLLGAIPGALAAGYLILHAMRQVRVAARGKNEEP